MSGALQSKHCEGSFSGCELDDGRAGDNNSNKNNNNDTNNNKVDRCLPRYSPRAEPNNAMPDLRRNGRFYVLPKSGKRAKNRFFSQKKHPKLAKRLIFIGEKDTFSFPQLCLVLAGTYLSVESEGLFLGPKIRISARKSVFSYETLFFSKGRS